MYLCCIILTITMQTEKDEEIIEQVTDQEAARLLETACYNWKVASTRLETIVHDYQSGAYMETGLEIMAIVGRLEHACEALLDLPKHAQCFLLKRYNEEIKTLSADKHMDEVMATYLAGAQQVIALKRPSVWKRLYGISEQLQGHKDDDESTVKYYQLLQEHIIPHMDAKQMAMLLSPQQTNEEVVSERDEVIGEMVYVLDQMKTVGNCGTQILALALGIATLIAESVRDATNRYSLRADDYCTYFAQGVQELLESHRWQTYWQDHLKQIHMRGETLEEDMQEVEEQLLSMPHYLYARLNESPMAFGQALMEADLDDDTMLHLLFLLTKKEQLLRHKQQQESQEARLVFEADAAAEQRLEDEVIGHAMRLQDDVSEAFFPQYEQLWRSILKCPSVRQQLREYSKSKFNRGFNMQLFCNIVGLLNQKYKIYGHHSSVDLGKSLGGKKNFETFKKYIGQTETLLNRQSIREIELLFQP